METNIKNGGLINRDPKPTDWVADKETGIMQGNVVAWAEYLPAGEAQDNELFDTLACTHFASGHIYETMVIYLWKTGQLSADAITFFTQFLTDKTNINSFRVSKQFSAIVGKNTQQGNYATNAWDTWRLIGGIPDSMLNTLATAKSWTEYMEVQITPEMMAIAKQSLQYVDVTYQWLNVDDVGGFSPVQISDLQNALKTSPVNTGIPQLPYTNHSVEMYGVEDATHWDLFNSYIPFEGQTYYNVGWALQGTVTPHFTPPKPSYDYQTDLEFGMTGKEVYELQLALVDQGMLNKNLVNADPDLAYFGQNTENGVKQFQAKYANDILVPAGIKNPTGMCYKFTCAKLNELYSPDGGKIVTNKS